MKNETKLLKNLETAFTLMPPPQRLQEPDPDKLEVFDQAANTRITVNRAGHARWSKLFEMNMAAKGITFKTKIGAFKLTIKQHPDDSIGFALENLKDKSRLTARLLDDPEFLLDFRNYHNAMAEFQGRLTKFNRPSSRVPCLLIEWKEATCERSAVNHEILSRILTAAAFGHLKHWWRTARRVQNIILHSPPVGPRPFLIFSSGKTAAAVSGSAR